MNQMNITKLTDIELAKLLASCIDETIHRDLLSQSYVDLALKITGNALKNALYRFADRGVA